jgi:NAD(P)-dependent dehydrogenase (short-subunit alcohol dehydrogenase family)
VTSDESVDAGFSKARAAQGQERILVNCAGVGGASDVTRSASLHPTRRRCVLDDSEIQNIIEYRLEFVWGMKLAGCDKRTRGIECG